MALFSFSKKPKHRSFDYQPRYYDESKEKFADRRRNYSEDEKANAELAKQRIRGNFGKAGKIDSGYRRKAVRKSNYTLFIIIAVLCIIGYLVLNKLAPTIVNFTN